MIYILAFLKQKIRKTMTFFTGVSEFSLLTSVIGPDCHNNVDMCWEIFHYPEGPLPAMVFYFFLFFFFASSLTISCHFFCCQRLHLLFSAVSNRSSGHTLLSKYQDTWSGKEHLYLDCVWWKGVQNNLELSLDGWILKFAEIYCSKQCCPWEIQAYGCHDS